MEGLGLLNVKMQHNVVQCIAIAIAGQGLWTLGLNGVSSVRVAAGCRSCGWSLEP